MNRNKVSHDSETPAKGRQVITACAFIHRQFSGEDKVFLAKRADSKKFRPGKYELPGGHIDFGESMVDGLKREILEEFQVKIKVGDPFFVFTYLNPVKGSHSLEAVYFATFVDPVESIKLHPGDHSEYGWFADDEIDENVKDKEDREFFAIRKGFALLRGEQLEFT